MNVLPKDSSDLDASVTTMTTMVDLLRARSLAHPQRQAYQFLNDGVEEAALTYGELDCRARAVAVALSTRVPAGSRALMLYPPGLDFIAAFFGCLYAGVVPVPVYPPGPARLARSLPRLRAVIDDADVGLILSTSPLISLTDLLFAQAPDLAAIDWMATDAVTTEQADDWRRPAIDGGACAFLQYTSGSTSAPKGVVVSHGNLMGNQRTIQEAFGTGPSAVIVGWLPVYHDMGLIGNVMHPLFLGASCYLMSPLDFLQRPLGWLKAISRYGATVSGGPNFAYDLCARRLASGPAPELDLSSWEVAFNGSEPIRPETLERFAAAFEPFGFRRQSLFPCYGLAESTLFVSGSGRARGAHVMAFEAAALEKGRAEPALEDANANPNAGKERSRTLVSSGRPHGDHRCVVVDSITATPAAEGHVGEIWVSSTSVAQGYFQNPVATEETFHAHLADEPDVAFLRTGDLGFVCGEDLFVTGRLKDLIIIAGRNHHPQDLERTAEASSPALRPGCSAAFAVESDGLERVVVVSELDGRFDGDRAPVMMAVRQAISEAHEVDVGSVALVRAGTILKTSSGKVRRSACRAAFLDRSLEPLAQDQRAILANAGGNDGDLASREPLTAAQLGALREEDRAARLESHLLNWVACALRRSPSIEMLDHALTSLGLDSLAAVELKALVESDFGVPVALSSLFGGQTVRGLAQQILDASASVLVAAADKPATGPTPARAPEIAAATAIAPSREAPRLSVGQRALWFLHQLAPESAAYNVIVPLRLGGEWDLTRLDRALAALAQAHPQLRTTYALEDGEPRPRLSTEPQRRATLEQIDARGWTDAELTERLQRDAHRPLDLRKGPLLVARVFTRATEEHVLLLVFHHIAVDFWSLENLARDLLRAYDADSAEALLPNALALETPPGDRGYQAFARWQAELMAGTEGERQLAYWRKALAGAPAAINLPVDLRRPAVQTYAGGSSPFVVAPAVRRALLSLAQREQVTPFTLLLAAFQTLLARYSGDDDILIGVPMAGRTRPGFRDLCGYFVNPMPLRARFDDAPSFRALLRRTEQTVLGAFDHQDYPFAALVERLAPAREQSRPPFFQTMFLLQRARPGIDPRSSLLSLGEDLGEIALGRSTLRSYPLRQRVSQVDLTLAMAEAPDVLAGSLQYNTDLFRPDTAQRMVESFQTLLESLVAAPDDAALTLPILSSAERRRTLAVGVGPREESPPTTVVAEWRRAVAQHGPRLAITAGERRLTYLELDAASERFAARLRGAGVRSGQTVALCCERSIETIAALLGILKTGAAYVPLDPASPRARVDHILEDAGVVVAVAGKAERDLVAKAPRILTLEEFDDENEEILSRPADAPSIQPDDLAYVIYTSGTTGKPKGVMARHRNVAAYAATARRRFEIGERDRVLQFASLAFDTSVEEIFGALLSGAALVLRDAEMLRAPARFLERCATAGVTVLDLPTAYWHELAEAAQPEDWRRASASLRLIVIGGEKAKVEKLRAWNARAAGTLRLLNTYGPTETTVAVACADLTALEPASLPSLRELPIGTPLENTALYVLDPRGEPVPMGVVGELFIAGNGVTGGYLNAPELTAERFVPNPFADDPAALMYRSGDRVRMLPDDGGLEYVGRADQQVKIRGFRVEPAEIEAKLLEHPEVRDAAVVAREDAAGAVRLVAYVVAAAKAGVDRDVNVDVGRLRAFLREALPAYCVPAVFVALPRLPLSSSGKVDRRALPEPPALPSEAAALTPPSDHVEETLCAIWGRSLGIERIGVDDSFFDLGGHSLLLPGLLAEIEAAFGQEVPMVKLFEHPTVRSLAHYLAPTSTVSPAAPAIASAPDSDAIERARRGRQVLRRRHDPKPPEGNR